MDQIELLVLGAAGVSGLLATLSLLARDRRTRSQAKESEFAVSTEGMKRCPSCGLGNLVADSTCAGCGSRLRG